ncbi:MAG TPA: hypothetical protein VHP11_13525 [Tepidisphaeraceae bacterium]|nr:hypothetical protein [Tepidisphaeraceae bacterium]
MTFCSDVDLLYWEPNVFRDAAFASQQLLSGTGQLDGTRFTTATGSLTAAHVVAGQVIVLSGTITGSYPIVQVNGAAELYLSVLYDGMQPSSGPIVPSPVAQATNLTYAIRTFWAQQKVVSDLLMRTAGIDPEADDEQAPRIVNAEALRRPCVLGTLQMIYNALAAAAAEPAALSVRAELYERLYRRAVLQTRVELDRNGDGRGDVVRQLNVLELQRGYARTHRRLPGIDPGRCGNTNPEHSRAFAPDFLRISARFWDSFDHAPMMGLLLK